jgi:sigma-B regulation protein RsbU (phosphoserine phosphatase)
LRHEEVVARVNTHLTIRKLQKGLEDTNAQLREALSWIDREIDEIAGLQRDLLPRREPAVPGMDIATYWKSYDRAGGDYYDFVQYRSEEETDDEPVGFLIADVSGHGPSAAVVVAMLHTLLHAMHVTPASPAAMLELLNQVLSARPIGNNFITAFFAWYYPRARRLCYARAGHNPPLLREPDGTILRLGSKTGVPLGVLDKVNATDEQHIILPGGSLLLYTDGITEAIDEKGAFFEERRLIDLLAEPAAGAAELRNRVLEALTTFEGGSQPDDDKTLIAIHWTGA